MLRVKLLIIRHGQSEADLLNVHEGRADYPLTEMGRRQADAMAAWVADNFQLDRIYCSTLTRARQTAQPLAERTGLVPVYDPDLMEHDNGQLAGVDRAEAARRFPARYDIPVDQSRYGMESRLAFRTRSAAALGRILSAAGERDTVAAVCHGGTINQLYGAFLGLPVDTPLRFRTADTGVHCWEIRPGWRGVLFANYSEHIREIGNTVKER